jgi:hypothetical protein
MVLASSGVIDINGAGGVNINSGTGITVQSPGGMIMAEGSFTTVGAISSASGDSGVITALNGKTVHVSKGIITQIE